MVNYIHTYINLPCCCYRKRLSICNNKRHLKILDMCAIEVIVLAVTFDSVDDRIVDICVKRVEILKW